MSMYMQEQLNMEKSIEMLRSGFAGVKKQCYDNLFANFDKMVDLERAGNTVEPIICFIQFGENIFTRHACFILNGEIIDTTYAQVYLDNCNEEHGRDLPKYKLIKRFTPSSYLKELDKERVTSLDNRLFAATMEGAKQLMTQGCFVL